MILIVKMSIFVLIEIAYVPKGQLKYFSDSGVIAAKCVPN